MTLRTVNALVVFDSNGLPTHAYLDNARYTIPTGTSVGTLTASPLKSDATGIASVGVAMPTIRDVSSPFEERAVTSGTPQFIVGLGLNSAGRTFFVETWTKT